MSKSKKIVPLPSLPLGVTLVDSHCHLDMEPYAGDREEVVRRAAAAGVGRMITIGIDLASSRQAVALAGAHAGVYAAVGVHPHHPLALTEEDYQQLACLARSPKVVAYGEIGLDTVRSQTPLARQREHFRRQILLAQELGLPIIVHDREAHAEILAILQELAPYPAGGVMHCFSGDYALARAVLALGFAISIPGVVTFNNAVELQETVRQLPLSALLLETDGPYLAPVPHRGKRNQPAWLLHTAQKVAELQGVSLAEVAQATSANAGKLFGI